MTLGLFQRSLLVATNRCNKELCQRQIFGARNGHSFMSPTYTRANLVYIQIIASPRTNDRKGASRVANSTLANYYYIEEQEPHLYGEFVSCVAVLLLKLSFSSEEPSYEVCVSVNNNTIARKRRQGNAGNAFPYARSRVPRPDFRYGPHLI